MPKKILAVDDEASIRKLVSDHACRTAGYEVDTAYDGQEALDKIAISKPRPRHPRRHDAADERLGGAQAAARDPTTKDLPILILSAVGEFEAQLQGMESSGDDYITKPFRPQELGDLVEEMLDPSKAEQHAGEHTEKQAKLRAMVDIMHRSHDKD